MNLRIDRAGEQDVPLVLSFIRKLAEYERRPHEVTATEEGLREALFGARSFVEVLIAYSDETPVGFALYFPIFSTFRGRPGLFLEDLFVDPEYRGRGIGTALLAALASVGRQRGCIRLEWWVLKWNQAALAFYKRLGATEVDEWGVYRLDLAERPVID